MFQAEMSLVKGSAAAQFGSSSSLRPCGVVSFFIVTTQVLLRSVVESSHWPTIAFFSAAASCGRCRQHCRKQRRQHDAGMARRRRHQRPFTGVSATGVSGGLPANQFLRLSTTS